MWNETVFLELFAKNSSPYQPTPEQVVNAKLLADTESKFDFSSLILAIPRGHMQRDALDAQMHEYISKLENLYETQPLCVFKLVAVLLTLDNYAFNQFAIRDVFGLFERWFNEEKITCKDKVDIGTQLWISCGHSLMAHFKINALVPLLMPLYLEKSVTEPAYIVEKFELMAKQKGGGEDYRSCVFSSSSCVENPDDFLQFARNVHHLKPTLLPRALLKCLFEGRRLYQTALKEGRDYHYQPNEQQLRAVSNELFDKFLDAEGTQYTCQRLIVEAYADEYWYPQLFEKLWQIERAKPKNDEQTINNCFLVVMNADVKTPMYAEAKEKIENWATSYEVLYQQGHDTQTRVDWLFWLEDGDQSKCGLMVAHAKKLLDSIDEAMTPFYPKTRNLSLPVPQTHEVMTFLESIYWQMVAWLLNENQYVALRVLVVGFQTNEDYHTNSSLTNQISQVALSRFMSIFEQYHKTNTHETALLMEHIINLSRYSDYNKRLGKLLDEIFPMFELIAPNEAHDAYEKAHKNDGSRSHAWYYHRKKM